MAAVSGIACLILGTAVTGQNWLVYVAMILVGATALGFGGIYVTQVSEIAGAELVGFASGFVGMILALGGLTGPPIFGYIVDKTGSYQIAWLVMAACGLLAAMFAVLVREKKSNF